MAEKVTHMRAQARARMIMFISPFQPIHPSKSEELERLKMLNKQRFGSVSDKGRGNRATLPLRLRHPSAMPSGAEPVLHRRQSLQVQGCANVSARAEAAGNRHFARVASAGAIKARAWAQADAHEAIIGFTLATFAPLHIQEMKGFNHNVL